MAINSIWTLALAPAAWIVLFGTFVIRARVALGYWPHPYHPDPKDLDFTLHYFATLAGMPLMFAAVLSAVTLALVSRRQHRAALVGLASLAAVMALARFDPLGLFTWLGD